VFKRFNACLSQGIDEFGGFGRFGLVGLRSLMCLRGLMPAYRQGFDKLIYTTEIIHRVGVGI
jgi:hypothetical protein